MTNVFGARGYATVQAELQAELLRWYMETSDVTPWSIDPRTGGYPWPPPRAAAAEGAAAAAQVRAGPSGAVAQTAAEAERAHVASVGARAGLSQSEVEVAVELPVGEVRLYHSE